MLDRTHQWNYLVIEFSLWRVCNSRVHFFKRWGHSRQFLVFYVLFHKMVYFKEFIHFLHVVTFIGLQWFTVFLHIIISSWDVVKFPLSGYWLFLFSLDRSNFTFPMGPSLTVLFKMVSLCLPLTSIPKLYFWSSQLYFFLLLLLTSNILYNLYI